MKVVKKLLAPVLVVGLLLTSLVTLHNLKDTKKDNVFRIGISQYITHKSLDATRKGFIEELKKEGYVKYLAVSGKKRDMWMGKIFRLISKMLKGSNEI